MKSQSNNFPGVFDGVKDAANDHHPTKVLTGPKHSSNGSKGCWNAAHPINNVSKNQEFFNSKWDQAIVVFCMSDEPILSISSHKNSMITDKVKSLNHAIYSSCSLPLDAATLLSNSLQRQK